MYGQEELRKVQTTQERDVGAPHKSTKELYMVLLIIF